jgi:hypothetical protein
LTECGAEINQEKGEGAAGLRDKETKSLSPPYRTAENKKTGHSRNAAETALRQIKTINGRIKPMRADTQTG